MAMGDRDLSPKKRIPNALPLTIIGNICGGYMKEIQLTRGKVALVDDEMFEELNQYKWVANKIGRTHYAIRSLPRINGKRKHIKMHHVVFGYPPKGFVTDHINGNGLFNLSSNLRFITQRQNCQNRKNTKKTSKYPGVSWNKCRQVWESCIQIEGKKKYLGYHHIELEAFNAYRAEVESLGETVVGVS